MYRRAIEFNFLETKRSPSHDLEKSFQGQLVFLKRPFFIKANTFGEK
ncbi:hypothetical protein P872_05810 [Rhodonellum psychrophilum GCM71 = DSM 17998]|uniref:Uncharacterized protein n=2 Tax=Rhodonellum TaxID=336827 RepID=U5BPP2_9BACT|nr:hypothetical protein P872_05810 [Rhodonellum psychrophilum GCM71 = DSM 17998]SDY54208.1 hypothetical protein SAMN05444412_101476 [Rhodonellum ikkaensis]